MTENLHCADAPQTNAVRLRHFTTRLYGLSQPPPYQDRGIPFVRATNVERGKLVRSGLAFVSEGDLPESRAIRLVEGDIIVVRSGAYTGDSALVTADWAGGVAGFDIVVRVDRYGDPRFVAYSLLSPQVLQGQIDPMRSRAAQPHLNAEELGDVVLALPPMECQRAIADYLDRETARLDALVAVKERLLGLLVEKRRALITRAVTRGLDPHAPLRDSGIHWLGETPAHWGSSRLKFIAHVQGGLALGKNYGMNELAQYPYLRVANVQDGHLDLSEIATVLVPLGEARSCELRPGDVLMNEGGDADKLGRGCVWNGEIHPCLHQNHVFAVRPTAVASEWLSAWTSTEGAKAYFESHAKQATNLASISTWNIKELPVPLPPPAEQGRILSFIAYELANLSDLESKLSCTVDLLLERRSALIAAAVTGQLDIGSAA